MALPNLDRLTIKIFADGADIEGILAAAADRRVAGFTTNPTLMRAAGVADYRAFAENVLRLVPDRPVCFEVFADDLPTMNEQAYEVASWGENVYVKFPVSTSCGESCAPSIALLSNAGVKLNVTAVMTLDQVARVCDALAAHTPAIVSVFAGRIADTGRDPVPHMEQSARLLRERPLAELLWASPRELLNVFQADAVGCHIITLSGDLLKKLGLVAKDLEAYSRETVAMFRNDAVAAGFEIPLGSDHRPRGIGDRLAV